jgi:hypothetical protein
MLFEVDGKFGLSLLKATSSSNVSMKKGWLRAIEAVILTVSSTISIYFSKCNAVPSIPEYISAWKLMANSLFAR